MRKWHSTLTLFLENPHEDPCPSSTDSQISKHVSFLYDPGIFQTAASMCLFVYLFVTVGCTVSFRVGTLFPLTLLVLIEPRLLIFKVAGGKPR